MTDSNDITGKQVLISGAAAGIGRETAIMLSKLGCKLVSIDIDKDGLIDTMSNLAGSGHSSYLVDLGNLESIEPKVKEIVDERGPFDGFVHCAGIRSRRPISMITPSVLSEVLKLNFGSFIELTRCITKKNNYNKGLSIVGVSSIASQRGGVSVTAYAASKAAMDCAVRCLAKELGPKAIRLNTVVPSQIKTRAYVDFLKLTGGAEDITLSRQYLGLGEPMDVANVIGFLLSHKSKFITGSSIPVDGGFLSS